MEIPVNREIRSYHEAVFWGLSLRQLFFGVLAVIVSIAVYFLLQPALGSDIVSWLCILAAAPFAFFGFFNWHGMTAEKVLFAWIKHRTAPAELPFVSTNYTTIYFKELLDRLRKEEYQNGTENAEADTTEP